MPARQKLARRRHRQVVFPTNQLESGLSRMRFDRDTLAFGLKSAIVPWLVTRMIVIPVIFMAREIATKGHLPLAMTNVAKEGLFSWDAGWYELIAAHGYGAAGYSSLRFFPLVPLLARGVSYLPFMSVRISLLAVSNLSALLGLVLMVVLAKQETGDSALAVRTAWLMSLAPAAFTYVMGYTEATLLVFTVATFIALRNRRWWWAMVFGILAGLTRPIGILLAVPALIEGLNDLRQTAFRERLGRLAAVAGGPIGVCSYLVFLGLYYHHPLAPITIERQHRGGFNDPLATLYHEATLLAGGRHLGEALHLPWALLAIALVAIAFWRLPASYGAFCAAIVLVALSGQNIDSFERYAMSAFPLVIVGAMITSGPRMERYALAILTASLVAYSTLAFLHIYVP
ncbi:MAG: mannosyltransferase family protein [Acidimicrobiales bacterium]